MVHTCLQKHIEKAGKSVNYMNVPAADRESEKAELIRLADKNSILDHAVTATQKVILDAFRLDASLVMAQAIAINDDLIYAGNEET